MFVITMNNNTKCNEYKKVAETEQICHSCNGTGLGLSKNLDSVDSICHYCKGTGKLRNSIKRKQKI